MSLDSLGKFLNGGNASPAPQQGLGGLGEYLNRSNVGRETQDQYQEREKRRIAEQQKKAEAIRKANEALSKKSMKPTAKKKKKKEKDLSLWDDLKAAGKTAYQAFNPFDDVDMAEAVKNYTERNTSKAFDEIARGSSRTVDSASLGAMSNLDKKLNERTPYYTSQREFGEGGGTDMLTTGLGYLAPGLGMYKGLNALKAGIGLTQFGAKGIGQRLASETAKGAIIGAGMSGTEVGIREGLNPDDYNWKQNLGYIGMNTGIGAVADPLLYGAGKGIAKGFESASNRTMKNLLPNNATVEQALNRYTQSVKADNALPVKNKNLYDDLIPKGNNFTNPDFVPSVTSKPKPQVEAPNIVNPKEQQLKLTQGQIEEWKPILDEFEQAVEQQYQYLKNSMGKGVEYGSTGGGGLGNFKEVNGGFRISNNPKWYQDFYKQNGRKPNNVELRELAKQHVREGFQDEVGNLPAWQPKKAQELDNEIEETLIMIQENPEQEEILKPILQGLEEDKASILNDLETAFTEIPALNKQLEGLGGTAPKTEPVKFKQQEPAQPTQPQEVPVNRNTPEPQAKPEQEPVNAPQETVARPENIPYVQGERKHYSTITNSEKVPDEFIDGIKNLDRRISNSISDQEAADFANQLIKRDAEEAFQFVKNADIRDKRHVTVGARLIDEFNKTKQFERAVDMADILAKEGTKFGQGLQSFSMYNKLTVEGNIILAQRKVIKLNQTLPEGKKVVLTPEIVEDISATAGSIQKLTGQIEIGNNVISLLEKAKKGNRLTDEELKSVHSFMTDAKKFVGDIDPKAKPPKVKPVNGRTRDKVVDFMGKQEMEAKKRIEARRNRANSLPVDIFYDYAVVGASKIAKGFVKFSDFSEQMIKELGDEVKPWMQQIYNEAVKNFNLTSDKITPKRLSHAEKLVNKAIADKSLTAEQANELMELTTRLVNAAGDSKMEASMDLQVVLNRLEQPTFAQMASSAMYQAMLTNPLTIMRNVLGNEMFYRIDRISKYLAVPLDVISSKITGNQRTISFTAGHFQWGNFFNPMKDYGKGLKLGTKAGWKGVNPLGINTAYDIKSPAFSSDAQNLGWVKKALVSKFNLLHWTEKILGVTMRSFDTAGYMRAYNTTLREQATLKAINEGLKGKALQEAAERYFQQADENMIAIAEQYGKYATFQDNTALAKGMTVAKEKLNEISSMVATGGMSKTKEFGVGSFIIPFPKTPANLVMRAIDYSPAGLLRAANLLKNYLRVSKNPLDAREAQLAFSRAIVGTTGFTLFGYLLAEKGVLTSAGNSDYKVRELERMAGKQPNSVNVSAVKRFILEGFNMEDLTMKKGDTFVSYDWMQPLSIAVALGTGISQATQESKDPTTTDKIVGAADSAVNTIINMSALSGINRLISGPPGESWSEKFAGSLSNSGSSFIPTLSNQVRKMDDNTTRSTYEPTFGGKFKNAIINKIPGKEKELPPSYNTLGEKKELYQNKTNNLLNIFLNPSFVSKVDPSPEAKFLVDYMNKSGDKSFVPPIPDKKIDGIALSGKQYAAYQKLLGTKLKEGVQDLIPKVKGWRDPNDTQAIGEELEDIFKEAKKEARSETRSKLVSKEALAKAKKEFNLSEDTILKRIEKGWTLTRALNTPN
jgi:hypothetical protein